MGLGISKSQSDLGWGQAQAHVRDVIDQLIKRRLEHVFVSKLDRRLMPGRELTEDVCRHADFSQSVYRICFVTMTKCIVIGQLAQQHKRVLFWQRHIIGHAQSPSWKSRNDHSCGSSAELVGDDTLFVTHTAGTESLPVASVAALQNAYQSARRLKGPRIAIW